MNKDVLNFYKSMPFNFRESADHIAKDIKSRNLAKAYPVIDPVLKSAKTVLEIGCGVGWMSNTLAYHYKLDVTAIDFNPVAIKRAKETAEVLGLDTNFQEADLFTFEADKKFDFVLSLGVLHHTDDCLGAIERVFTHYLKSGGKAFIGLYHTYGRAPFLEHFEKLKEEGKSEDELFKEYARLHGFQGDAQHLESWFRDQVLHPHETCHTISEVVPIFDKVGAKLVSSSTNGFKPFSSPDELFDGELELRARGEKMLEQGKYFPGFFVFLVEKK